MKKNHSQPSDPAPASEPHTDPAVEVPEVEVATAEPVQPVPAVDEVAELKDKLLRTQAEYQNYRKRMSREMSDARRVGVVDTVEVFLPLFDHFGMAMQAVEKSDNIAAIKQGLAMIAGEYAKALEELGVRKFDSVGLPFDPARHEAVAQEPSDTVPAGTVSREWNAGYSMGDRILRPARVVVSSGPAAATGAE